MFRILLLVSCIGALSPLNGQNPRQPSVWVTTPDKKWLLSNQTQKLLLNKRDKNRPTITVNTAQKFQKMDGFGGTLTGGSAYVINQKLNAKQQNALLRELFSRGTAGAGINYLRISIGASDMDAVPFSYSDLPDGATDTLMQKFSIAPDKKDLIPVLKKILKINPGLKIMGSPWSPPKWMKTNNSTIGGKLKPEFYAAYARYFVKYVQAMQREGIRIDAITIQNEPENPKNNPSLDMTAEEQRDFIKFHLGPAFKKAKITTKIVIFDHNCDHPVYPISILNDAQARQFIDGSAFHLYAGEITAMSEVQQKHPDKNLYFTEQWTSARGDFGGDVSWGVKNLVVGASRNWAKTVLQWNLATDDKYQPHTEGGCTECLGFVTIGDSIKRNQAFYTIAHASKFVPAGSVRVGSNEVLGFSNVAFLTPSGKTVVVILNEEKTEKTLNITVGKQTTGLKLPANAVATFVY